MSIRRRSVEPKQSCHHGVEAVSHGILLDLDGRQAMYVFARFMYQARGSWRSEVGIS